jgi:deoxycytidylate deaminase
MIEQGWLTVGSQVVHAEANALLNKNQAQIAGAVSSKAIIHYQP